MWTFFVAAARRKSNFVASIHNALYYTFGLQPPLPKGDDVLYAVRGVPEHGNFVRMTIRVATLEERHSHFFRKNCRAV